LKAGGSAADFHGITCAASSKKPATFITLVVGHFALSWFRFVRFEFWKKKSEAIVGPFVEQRSGILPRIVLGAEGGDA